MKRTRVFRLLAFVALFASSFVGARAHPATGIVLDGRGQIYFSDLETIWKLDARGQLSVFRPGVGGRHVHELAIDDAGNIYGADVSYVPASETWIHSVWRMTGDGQQTYLVAPTDKPPRGLSIRRDRAGNTFFAEQDNNRKRETLLLRRTPAGEVSIFAGGAHGFADGKGAAARFTSIGGMTFAPDDSLYVADGGAVRRIESDGTVRTLAKDLSVKLPDDSTTGYGSLMGIAVGADSSVFAADYGNRRVLKINSDGKVSRLLRVESPWSPTGVATTVDGSVYVLEIAFTPPGTYKGPRVRRIAPDGKTTTLATIGEAGQRSEAQTSRADESSPSVEEKPARAASHLALASRPAQLIAPALLICFGVVVAGALLWRRHTSY
jgi:hypothetical protein